MDELAISSRPTYATQRVLIAKHLRNQLTLPLQKPRKLVDLVPESVSRLGSAEIGVEGLTAGTALLTSQDPDARTSRQSVQSGLGKKLDLDVFGTSTQATVTTVPEPGALILWLLGITSVGGIALVRRRRQRQVHKVIAN